MISRKSTRCALAALLAILAATAAAPFALAADGGLLVRVIEGDDESSPLPGVTVVVRNEASGFEVANVTDVEGKVTFANVPAGEGYVVSAELAGFGKRVLSDVRVVPGQVVPLQIGLTPEIREDVTVVDRGDVVELETGGTRTTEFSDEFIADLPVQGRNYQSVLSLAPGVQDTDGDGNPNVNGARSRDFQATVDGVSNRDPLTGNFMSFINPDSIEEIEVVTLGADASFGGVSGGFARIVQKQGGNELEGTFNLFFRDSLFDGDGAGGSGRSDPLDFQHFQPSVFLAGPIVKDHLWYSLSHEYLKTEIPIDVVNGTDFVQTVESTRSSDKITWQVNPRNKLAVTFNADPLEQSPSGVNSVTPAESGFVFEQGGPTYSLKWTAPYSATFFWESTLAFSDTGIQISPVRRDFPNSCIPLEQDPLGLVSGDYCLDTDTTQRSGPYFIDYEDFRKRWTYKVDADQFISDFLGGTHQVRAGVQLERVHFDRDLTWRPTLLLSEAPQLGNVLPDPTTGQGGIVLPVTPVQVTRTISFPEQSNNGADGNYYAAYIQDNFQPFSNLIIRVGLRYSREELSSNGYVPFDPRAEREVFDGLVSQCVNDFCAGQPDFDSCARIVLPSCIGGNAWKAFTVHPVDFEFATSNSCNNPDPNLKASPNFLMCTLIQQAGFGNFDQLKVRQRESYSITNSNLEPRLSISWDPNNDSKTKISATWGRFYNQTFLLPLVNENGPDQFTEVFQTNQLQRIGRALNANVSGFSINAFDRNARSSYATEWTVGVEREIARETVVGLTYVSRKFNDQFQDTDINHEPVFFDDIPESLKDFFRLQNGIGCKKIGEFADCTGRSVFVPGRGSNPFSRGRFVDFFDDVPDLQAVSPFFNRVFQVGNFNRSIYEAYQLTLTRRYFQNWELQLSYVWSKATGQAEDFNQGLGDDPTVVDDEFGFLDFDQRHVVKVNGRVNVPWWGGFRLGWAMSYQSGLPYSFIEQRFVSDFPTDLSGGTRPSTQNSIAFRTPRTLFTTGVRNDHRSEPYWDVNINFQKEFNIGGVRATAQFDVFNLLNDDSQLIDRVNVTRVPRASGGFKQRFRPVSVRRFGRSFQLALKANF